MRTPDALNAVLYALEDAGLEQSLAEEVYTVFKNSGVKPSALRSYLLLIKAALKGHRVDDALKHLHATRDVGQAVPTSCIMQILRHALHQEDILTQILSSLLLPYGSLSPIVSADGFAAVMDQAVKVPGLLVAIHEWSLAEGVALEAASYEALVRGYISLSDTRATRALEEMLGHDFEPSDAVGLVLACTESKQVKAAEKMAEHFRQKQGALTLSMYAALMKVYSHSRLFRKVCDLHSQMQAEGVVPDAAAYGYLIRAAAESGRLELARRLFRDSGNPDLFNCMSLIRAAGRERDVGKAMALLEDLERSPVTDVDTTAYNCVLDVCVACGEHAGAKKLLERMQAKGHVDTISYNTFLKSILNNSVDGCCQAEVRQMMHDMRSHGLEPNAVTYNSLMNSSISRGDFHHAWELLDEMRAAGIVLDACTCSTLVKGVKQSLRQEDVERILTLIGQVEPDEVLVSDLLEVCVRFGNRSGPLLERVLERFRALGIVPSLRAYVTLIKAYGQARQLSQAWVVWQELTVKNHIALDEEACSCMIEACVVNGDLSGGLRILREMKRLLPSSPAKGSAFSALIKASLQRKQIGLALELYDEMDQDATVTCSLVTYNTLLDAFARAGDMNTVARLFQGMCTKGVEPDLITYSTVIKGYCVKGDLEKSVRLIGCMRQRGIEPDAVLYNSVLDGCAHQQMRELTEQVLADMTRIGGIPPSNFTLSILVKLYGRCRDLRTALEVVQAYPKQYGFDLNAQVYTCLMSACISNGQLGEALAVFDRMQAAGCMADSKTYQTLLSGCIKHNDLESAVRLIDATLDREDQQTRKYCVLEGNTVEAVLLALSRSPRAAELGIPLLERLTRAGIPVPGRARAALRELLQRGCASSRAGCVERKGPGPAMMAMVA